MNATSSTEVVQLTISQDSPKHNSQVKFNSLDGPDFFYYRTPSLFPGDISASSKLIAKTVSIRASFTVSGISMRQIYRYAMSVLESNITSLCRSIIGSCIGCEVEQVRNGNYKSSRSSSTGSTTSTVGGDFFGGENVTLVIILKFSDTSMTSSTAFGPLSNFLKDVSILNQFGDLWSKVTNISSTSHSIPTPLQESPVVYPQIGPSNTVRNYSHMIISREVCAIIFVYFSLSICFLQ